jgi:2-succinyl-6-hydroxy-2,4-cyclohexadiene-1-carboxylate synthase
VKENVVLLHGFAGTHRAFDGVVEQLSPERYLPLALDLPGHGEHWSARRPLTFESCVEGVLAQSPPSFLLCGYSLGGRIALQVALAAPERVSGLVLVSTTAGIEDPDERAARERSDGQLAERLLREPYQSFIEHWRAQPLFSSDPPEVDARARADHGRNRPEGLAAALAGLGTGRMAPLWGRLAELQMPVVVVVGSRDQKFKALGRRIVKLAPNARLMTLAGGHVLPLENPIALAQALAALAHPTPV